MAVASRQHLLLLGRSNIPFFADISTSGSSARWVARPPITSLNGALGICIRRCSDVGGPLFCKHLRRYPPRFAPVFASAESSSSGSESGHSSDSQVGSGLHGRISIVPSTTFAAASQFVVANYLPLVLVAGVLAGLASPGPGQVAHQLGLSRWTTCGIFFISGLNLRSGELKQAAQAWPVALFALMSILLITPLAAIPVLRLQLSPKELATGLAIFFCVPTTLSSAVSLTQLAGANTALALALTVASNILGILTMPFVLSKLFASGGGTAVPAGPLFQSLVQTILVPLLIGKICRNLLNLGRWVDGRKKQLSMLSSSFLALVPWMQVSCSKTLLLQIDPLNLLLAVVVGTIVHVVYLVCNTVVAQLLAPLSGLSNDEVTAAQRAVVLVASQKTLPVAIAVIGKLGGTLGEAGILVLPCIALHVIQITLDSFLVSYWVNSRTPAPNSGLE